MKKNAIFIAIFILSFLLGIYLLEVIKPKEGESFSPKSERIIDKNLEDSIKEEFLNAEEDNDEEVKPAAYTIQVGIFTKEYFARRMLDQMKKEGHLVIVKRIFIKGKSANAVLIGNFKDIESAKKYAKTKIKTKYYIRNVNDI